MHALKDGQSQLDSNPEADAEEFRSSACLPCSPRPGVDARRLRLRSPSRLIPMEFLKEGAKDKMTVTASIRCAELFNSALQNRSCYLDVGMGTRIQAEEFQEDGVRGSRLKDFAEIDVKGVPVSLKGNIDLSAIVLLMRRIEQSV